MSIVRDDCGERQRRVDRMIDEFREAQSRRRARTLAVKGDVQVVESQRNDSMAPVAGSTTTPASHEKH